MEELAAGELSCLERLPAELMGKIFIFCPDTKTFKSLLLSSSILLNTFIARSDFFLKAFLDYHVGPLVLPELLFDYHIQKIVDEQPENLTAVAKELAEQIQYNRWLVGERWDFTKVETLLWTHAQVAPLATLLLDHLLNSSPDFITYDAHQTPSLTETSRVESSLLLMNTWTTLELWSDKYEHLVVTAASEHAAAAGHLGIQPGALFMHGIERLFRKSLSVVQMDQIRCCGVMMSRHLATAVNDILCKDIVLPLTWASLGFLMTEPQSPTAFTLLQEGPHWVYTFLTSSRGIRMDEIRGLNLNRMDPSWIWPVDKKLKRVLRTIENGTFVPPPELSEDEPSPIEVDLPAEVPEYDACLFKSPCLDTDIGPVVMSGVGRDYWPEDLWEWLPAWGYTLWDMERIISFGLSPTDSNNGLVQFINENSWTSSVAIPEKSPLSEKGEWYSPFDQIGIRFRGSLSARRLLQAHDHSGMFNYEIFEEHCFKNMVPHPPTIEWCLEHYHRDDSCTKCAQDLRAGLWTKD